MVVVFGRPGSGKTTIAQEALRQMLLSDTTDATNIIGLDLDVCVPQWMRDNFANGIYPNLSERREFSIIACDYVEREQLLQQKKQKQNAATTVVSFSFVNTDLRDYFRQRFPHAQWALVDTTEQEANLRIQQRKGHFYKGKVLPATTQPPPSKEDREPADNADWKFAPVDFPHTILDGNMPVAHNAQIVVGLLEGNMKVL